MALTLFALTEWYLRYGRQTLLVIIGIFVWALVLSHNLTAAWVILILGGRGIMELVDRRRDGTLPRTIMLGGTVAAGVLLTWFWPYFDITKSPGLRYFPEGSEFADHPFHDMARLYLLAGIAGIWFLWHRRHVFLASGFLVTYLALQIFRALDYSYGNRFAFFQAFFAQVVVADGIAVGTLLAFRKGRMLIESFTLEAGVWRLPCLPSLPAS